jgi:hypothetical protein
MLHLAPKFDGLGLSLRVLLVERRGRGEGWRGKVVTSREPQACPLGERHPTYPPLKKENIEGPLVEPQVLPEGITKDRQL